MIRHKKKQIFKYYFILHMGSLLVLHGMTNLMRIQHISWLGLGVGPVSFIPNSYMLCLYELWRWFDLRGKNSVADCPLRGTCGIFPRSKTDL
jgi:hypothetical protein